MSNQRVEVKSMLTVISSKPGGSGKVHKLNTLDHALDGYTVHVIFYYPRSPFGSFDLDSVRIPLSEILSMYLPVVGRLRKNEVEGKWEVKCNDAGLRVLRAKVCVSVDEWLRSADGNEENHLTVWEDMPQDPTIWSPFRLQINEFEGGGVAIGLSCPHRQADPTTLTILLKTWTEAQRRQLISNPPSFSSLPFNLTATNSVTVNSNSKPISNKTTATATFKFSNSAFKKCLKVSIAGIFPDASPFDVFAALFWTRVAFVKRDCKRVSICVDLRRLFSSNYGFFGNALCFSSLEMPNAADDNVIGHVARLLNRHVASLEVKEGFNPLGEMYGGDLTIVNMEHMIVEGEPLMYETEFDNGVRPIHVSYRIGNAGAQGMITVMPSPEKGFGRTVAVTLPEEEMKKLLLDQDILRLDPKIILSGPK